MILFGSYWLTYNILLTARAVPQASISEEMAGKQVTAVSSDKSDKPLLTAATSAAVERQESRVHRPAFPPLRGLDNSVNRDVGSCERLAQTGRNGNSAVTDRASHYTAAIRDLQSWDLPAVVDRSRNNNTGVRRDC
jgi:hypothetical protein